jgi:hypothetical protein
MKGTANSPQTSIETELVWKGSFGIDCQPKTVDA